MARSAVDERIINMPIDVIIQQMRTVGSESNFALRSENPTPTGVWFRVHHGVSFTSWGEKITVTLTPMGQQTKVNIFSECGMPTQLVDYGKNRKVVNYLFDFIMRASYGQPASMAPPQNPAYPQAPQNQAYPQQVPQNQAYPQQATQNQAYSQQASQPIQQPAAQRRFCTNCGNQVAPGLKFCTMCGKPMQ